MASDKETVNKDKEPAHKQRSRGADYTIKYAKEKLKRIPLDVTKDYYDTIKSVAKSVGMSVNGFIKQAIQEKIDRLPDDPPIQTEQKPAGE